jgi:hypothetical protein
VLEESAKRTRESDANSSRLARAAVDPAAKEDDDTDSNGGSGDTGIADGSSDANEGQTASPRQAQSLSDPRVNASGEQICRYLLSNAGNNEKEIYTMWTVRNVTARDSFRRCLRYYIEACNKSQIDPWRIQQYGEAHHSLRRAMQWLFDEGKRSVRVISNVKSAVSTMFGPRFSTEPKLSKDRAIHTILKSFHMKRPVLKKRLHLNYTYVEATIAFHQ